MQLAGRCCRQARECQDGVQVSLWSTRGPLNCQETQRTVSSRLLLGRSLLCSHYDKSTSFVILHCFHQSRNTSLHVYTLHITSLHVCAGVIVEHTGAGGISKAELEAARRSAFERSLPSSDWILADPWLDRHTLPNDHSAVLSC